MPHLVYRLVETAAPEAEPLTLEEAKTHLRIGHDNEDEEISSLIIAARQACENMTGRSLITRSYSLYLDAWPAGVREIQLPRPPLLSVTAILLHGEEEPDELGEESYFVDAAGGRLVLAENTPEPIVMQVANGIEVQFDAGYGDAEDVPAQIRQAMKQFIAYVHAHRGLETGDALKRSGAALLLQPYRLIGVA